MLWLHTGRRSAHTGGRGLHHIRDFKATEEEVGGICIHVAGPEAILAVSFGFSLGLAFQPGLCIKHHALLALGFSLALALGEVVGIGVESSPFHVLDAADAGQSRAK